VSENHWRQQYTNFGSYEHEIARGNVRGAYPVAAYGRFDAPGAATNALVRCQDGTSLVVPQGVQMAITSTSAEDSAAGTGARTVIVEYLNGDLDLSFEIVQLNGTTAVNTLADDIRWVNAVYMATGGSTKAAVGVIDVTSNGDIFGRIKAGQRSTHSSFIRVPRTKTLYVSSIYAGVSSGTAAAKGIVELVSTQIDGLNQQETGLFYTQAGISLQDNSSTMTFNMPFPVMAGHIVGFIATVDKGATITAGYTGWIE